MAKSNDSNQTNKTTPHLPTVEIRIENFSGMSSSKISEHYGAMIKMQIKRKFQTAFPMEDCQDGVAFSEKRLCTEKNKSTNSTTTEYSNTSSIQAVSAIILQREIIEKIFSFLDIVQQIRLEAVCRQWRLTGKNQSWRKTKKLNLKPYIRSRRPGCTIDVVVEAIVSRCGKHLEKVNFTDTRVDESLCQYEASILQSLDVIAHFCPNLVQLDCYRASITNSGLVCLAHDCPKLEILTLESSSRFDVTGLCTFVKLCETLKSLQVTSFHDRDNDYFSVFINQNCNLRFLRIYPEALRLTTEAIEILFSRLDSIGDLHLPGCFYASAESLSRLFSKFGNTLRELYFEIMPSIPNARMKWGEGLCLLNNLERLSLRQMGVDDTVCAILANNCRKLEHVDFRWSYITDDGLRHLAALPSLKVLDVSLATNITSKGILALAKAGQLEKLYLGECDIQFADEACCSLARFCPNLKFLDASYLNISDLVVREFFKAIEIGFLKGPVRILIYGTDIDPSVETCKELELEFRRQYSPID